MSAFVSMLSSRIDAVLGRIRYLNAIAEDDPDRVHLKQDILRLTRRLKLQRRALLSSVAAGFVTTMLMITAFALAVIGVQHVWSAAALYIVALSIYGAAILAVGRDALISVNTLDQLGRSDQMRFGWNLNCLGTSALRNP
jgi:hypothetical protein